jgi:hypothetical protein
MVVFIPNGHQTVRTRSNYQVSSSSDRSSDREDEKKPSGFFEFGSLIRTARRRRIAKQFFDIDHPAAWK